MQSPQVKLPFTNEDFPIVFNLAAFIGWQIAIVNHFGDDPETAHSIVHEAQENIHKLMLGGSLPLGEANEVSLTNPIGAAMADLFGQSVEAVVDDLRKQEIEDVATN